MSRLRPTALTLVEVVAGLALLATLLVAVLTTKARVTRQWANAQRRLVAVDAADRLMTTWWADLARFPRNAAGPVPGDAGLAWRTGTIPNPAVNVLRTSVVRLEVFDARGAATGGAAGIKAGGSRGGEVLASVEVVLDDEPPPGVAGQVVDRGRP